MEAEISIPVASKKLAVSIAQALRPDNKFEVSEMTVTAHPRGKTLKVVIRGCRRIETLRATIDDIFRCIRAAETSLEPS